MHYVDKRCSSDPYGPMVEDINMRYIGLSFTELRLGDYSGLSSISSFSNI